MRALRPSYSPPSRKDLSGQLSEEVHAECEKEAACLLENKLVTNNLDGWSNVNQEPIICVSASTTIGDIYLLETIETGANAHDANYLQQIAQENKKSEEKFKFKVCGFVTDNASNVSKMKKQMEQNEDTGDMFFYGCSAHLLTLLAGDLKIPNVVDRVNSLVKYFKFTHKPHGWLKEKGSNKLKLPNDVLWNSVCYTLISYVNCWPNLLSIEEQEHRSEIKPEIYRTVTGISLKRNAEDFVKLLKPVAIALDSVQTPGINLSDSVAAWLKLGEERNEHLSTDKQAAFRKRMESALTPLHLLSYCLDIRFAEESSTKLSRDLADKAVNYAATVSDKLVPRSPPFDSPYMSEATRKSMMPADWWKLLDVKKDVLDTIQCILSCSPSTADLERIFSTYSSVHSKERNHSTSAIILHSKE